MPTSTLLLMKNRPALGALPQTPYFPRLYQLVCRH